MGWEHAAKGGQGFAYAGSETVDEVAWYGDNSDGQTHEVCGKRRNGYGLCDMSGNVWEWTSISFRSRQNIIGGSWADDHRDVGVDASLWVFPETRSDILGFRLVRDAP